MSTTFLGLDAAQILARLVGIVSEAAGRALVVRVGAEAQGHRNIGVGLPRAKTKKESEVLQFRVREALERERLVMAEHALVPKVGGTLRGQVKVKVAEGSERGSADAAHLLQAASQG